jgi:hypothetical protein
MKRLLADQEGRADSDIASEINRLRLFTRKDGQQVPASQILARANKYPHLFVRAAGKIRLAEDLSVLRSPNKPLARSSKQQASASSSLQELNFWHLGTIGDLMQRGLPNDSRLNHCGVYKLAVSSGYLSRFIPPDEARAAKNVINPWDVERLKSKWVLNTDIVYIGLAGRHTPRSLRKRLNDLLNHASGRTTDRGPHKGGEIVWQLRDHQQFHVWAAQTADPPIPRELEKALLQEFANAHGTLPFANRQP